MDLLLLEFCSGPIADESLHLLGKYSNVDVISIKIFIKHGTNFKKVILSQFFRTQTLITKLCAGEAQREVHLRFHMYLTFFVGWYLKLESIFLGPAIPSINLES